MVRKYAVGLGAALAALVTAMPAQATAEQAPEPRVDESSTWSRSEVAAAARDDRHPRAQAARQEHLQSQARSGRLVDARNVHAAVLSDGKAAATWERGTQVDELRLGRLTTDPTSAVSDVLELAMLTSEDPEGASDAAGAHGAGMSGALSYSGGTRLSSTCQTWSYSSSKITGCYQMFKPTNDGSGTRDYYAYNRWATAEGRVIDWGTDFYPVIVDARSRPYAGYASRTVGLTDYFPKSSSQLCNEGTSVNLGVGSLAFSIGLTNCGDKLPIVDATSRTMGLRYDDGFVFGGPRVKGVDFEMEVWNHQGAARPILGDYNYAKFCKDTLANCTATIGKVGW